MTSQGSPQGDATNRGVIRLVVVSPDGGRVLARPNGLAGWLLPTIPVALPFESWSPDATERTRALLGVDVEPVRRVTPDTWEVATTGRLSAAGNTWISAADVGRLGADEVAVRSWSASVQRERGDATEG